VNESPEKIRAFIAVEVSDESRGKIRDLAGRRRKGFHFPPADPQWSNFDNIHLTLQFLGNVDPAKVGLLGEAMTRVAVSMGPIFYAARGLGVFPAEYKPRVMWVGVKRGAAALTELQRRLGLALRPLGFQPEERAFHPHLTLARFKSNKGAREMMDVVRSHARIFCGETRADRIVLFRSQLDPKGAIYTELFSAPLTGEPFAETEPPVETNEDAKN
jgi:RNA 2',3'-cyclic 3'-phosphodiesterase